MASTKTLKTYIAAGSSNAASGTTTGTAQNHTTAYGGVITVKVTPGGTLTTAATVNVYTSGDNTNFKLFAQVISGLTNGTVYEWAFTLPVGAMYSRVDITGNVGAAVTCEAFCQELTTI
jgi:hypothetical protein